MTTTVAERPAPAPSAENEPSRRDGRRGRRASRAALVLVALGMVLIVALDGSFWWALLRVLAVGGVVAGAVPATIRGSRRRFASTILAVGGVALFAGAPILYSYGTTVGRSWRTAGGAFTAFGGLALVAIGLTVATGSLRGWRKALVVPAALVVAYAAGFPLTEAVYATNVARPALAHVTPADRGLAYRDATFVTTDGVRLSGWYIPSRNRAAIVVLHGASSTRTSVLDQAVVLARHGYGVLLFDARGHGRSAGRGMDFGWYGDRDIAAAVKYLQQRRDVDATRIGALGESMGGEEAIGAMATNHALRAVVGEGATNRVPGDWSWLSDAYGFRGRLQLGVHWLTYRLADLLSDASPPIALRAAARAASPRPILLITAGKVADEAHADVAVRAASPGNVEVWTVPGADHIGGLHTAPGAWTAHVTTFFDRALLRNRS
jgi:fermentation-respiration switch protein FrsA (DUF1100 family)